VKSKTTLKFWRLFERLPMDVQQHARRTYIQFSNDPSHPALHFKRVGNREPVYSVRIGLRYRALGLIEEETVTWFWIGPHDAYDQLLKG
jgi:hypothetical protein